MLGPDSALCFAITVLLTLLPAVSSLVVPGNVTVQIEASSHVCKGGDDAERVCTFRKLLLYRGRFIYVKSPTTSPAAEAIPAIPAYRPGPWKAKRIEIEELTIPELHKRLNIDTSASFPQLPWAALVYRMHADNWGHHMLDITPTLHRVLCNSPLKLCTHDASDLAKTWLVFYDHHRRHTGGFERTWGCFTHNPLIYASDKNDAMYNQVLVLDTAVVGWVWGSLIYDYGWSSEMAGSLYRRLWRCVGLDRTHTADDLPQTKVTIVQRPYAESSKARSFVNAAEAVDHLRVKHPRVVFEIVILDHLSFDEIVQVFHNSSIVVHVNGAAMGNMLFMRKGAVFVDMAPSQWYFGMVPAVEQNMKEFLQVSTRTYTSWHPEHNPVRWEVAARSPRFQELKRDEMVRVLRDHECPPAGAFSSYCKAHIIYTRSDFVLSPGLLQRVLTDGKRLLQAAAAAMPSSSRRKRRKKAMRGSRE